MKNTLCAVLGFAVIIFIALLSIREPLFTGAVTESLKAGQADEQTLHHEILNFYDVSAVQFPLGSCGSFAQDWYNAITHASLADERTSKERINFESTKASGTLDFLSDGFRITAKANVNEYDQLPINIELHGSADELFDDNLFVVRQGRIFSEKFNCLFVERDGRAVCNCD